MKLIKFEQSGFVLETAAGFRLGWDIATRTPIEKLDGMEPLDAFLVSHIHGDHFSPGHINALAPKQLFLNSECAGAEGAGDIKQEITTVAIGETLEFGGITVELFEVDHGPNVEQPKENMGFLIKVDGQNIYFAGDMFTPSGMPVDNLEVDIAMIPVGTHYTFGPREAFDFAKTFKSIGTIIPIHYSPNNYIYPETRDEFVKIAQGEFEIDLTIMV